MTLPARQAVVLSRNSEMKLKIIFSTRPGNAEIGALTTLISAVFGLDKELEYFENGLLFELEGDHEPLNDVLQGIHGNWPTNASHQDIALGFYPGGLEVCQLVIQQQLQPIITSTELS